MLRSLTLAALVLSFGCSFDGEVSLGIEDQVALGDTLVLSSTTPFDWDRVCLVHPYLHDDSASAALGFEIPSGASNQSFDQDNVLVFSLGGAYEAYARVPLSHDFGAWPARCIRRDEATFEADEPRWDGVVELQLIESGPAL